MTEDAPKTHYRVHPHCIVVKADGSIENLTMAEAELEEAKK